MIQHRARAGFLCLTAAVVVACGSSAPAASAPIAAPSIAVATPSPRPSPTPSPTPLTPTPGPSSTTSANLPRNGLIEVVSARYAVTLPDNWFRIDFSKADVDSFVKAGAGAVSSQVGDALAQQIASLAASNISLYAFRYADKKALLGTNLNVISMSSGGFDLATLEQLNIGQLKSLLGADTKIGHARVTLPAGEAVRLTYALSGSATTGNQGFELIQHLVVNGQQQVILTCTAPGSVTPIADECDAIARSLEFIVP